MINPKNNPRNYGIDLLRMISMFLILLIHILGNGGILSNLGTFTLSYHTAWLLNILAVGAVNCYAMISGYVMSEGKFRYHKIFSLWAQVIFYTLLITACFAIFLPGSVGIKDWIKAILPATMSNYWYFTAYFGMFFFIPFLNHLIHTLTKKQFSVLLFTCFILFSIIPTISFRDPFQLNSGYSMLWLAVLYLGGGYLKKYKLADLVKKRWLALTWLACILITWLSKVVIALITVPVFGEARYDDIFRNYTSPTIICIAVALVLLFAKTNLKNMVLIRIISIFSPLAFGVYLIHEHSLVREYLMTNQFVPFASFPVPLMILAILATALSIYIVCLLIDWVRFQLFRILRVSTLCQQTTIKIKEIATKVIKRG